MVQAQRTYTNHTSTKRARCVEGASALVQGGSSTANLHEPHQHREQGVSAYAPCSPCCPCTAVAREGSKRFGELEPPRTNARQHCRGNKVYRVLMHSFGVVHVQRTSSNYSNHNTTRLGSNTLCMRMRSYKSPTPWAERSSKNSPLKKLDNVPTSTRKSLAPEPTTAAHKERQQVNESKGEREQGRQGASEAARVNGRKRLT